MRQANALLDSIHVLAHHLEQAGVGGDLAMAKV